jgi:hypothetical protein
MNGEIPNTKSPKAKNGPLFFAERMSAAIWDFVRPSFFGVWILAFGVFQSAGGKP